MSPLGRPEGESLSAQREGSPISPLGRPEGGSTSAPLVAVESARIVYAGAHAEVVAVDDVSLQVAAGERLVLLGPSGCGKSSLLRALAGFEPLAAGRILLNGAVPPAPGPDRLMVFQEFDQLLPWKTVLGNVRFPLALQGRDGDEADARALELISRVGLAGFEDAFPHTLSGGMKQRVALSRALVLRPALLLMDEPFAALDGLTRHSMQALLLDLLAVERTTLVLVTHSIEEAVRLGTRIVVLSDRPGRIAGDVRVPTGQYEARARSALQDELERQLLTRLAATAEEAQLA
jgi:NitT/TauT family transport system ATP-binding protein